MAFPACVMFPANGMWFFSLLWDQEPVAFQLSGSYSKASPHFCLGSLPALHWIQIQRFAPSLFLLETFLGFAHHYLCTTLLLSLMGINHVQTKQDKYHGSWLNPQ